MTGASLGAHYLETCVAVLRGQKSLADRALAQLDDDQVRHAETPESNSIALVMKHLAGNMLSRWTDFLTTDGEKPWRDRDSEFIDDFPDRASLEAHWERGWACVLEVLESLEPAHLLSTVAIRGATHTVVQAIERQVSHYGYHVGQIVHMARALAGERWQTLSIPRGGSADYNREVGR